MKEQKSGSKRTEPNNRTNSPEFGEGESKEGKVQNVLVKNLIHLRDYRFPFPLGFHLILIDKMVEPYR